MILLENMTLEDFESCVDPIESDVILPGEFIWFLEQIISLCNLNSENNQVTSTFDHSVVDLLLNTNDDMNEALSFASSLRININNKLLNG